MAKLSGFQNLLALGSTLSAPRRFVQQEKFPIAIVGSTLSALLIGTATAILGSTLSAPFDGTRLHWKHRECSLGKHLESACPYPTRENPYFIGNGRGALLHRALTL